MKTGAAFFLKHSTVGKSTHAPGTAVARFRYVARSTAVLLSFKQHWPDTYKETCKWLYRRERDIRANGQVLASEIINLPYSLSWTERQAMLEDFCQAVGSARIPFFCALHNDTDAPHAHILFVDADYETGKRVFRFSDSGALWRLRKILEDVENRHLAKANTGLQVSRWGRDFLERTKAVNDNERKELEPKRRGVTPKLPIIQLAPPEEAFKTAVEESPMDQTLIHAKELLAADRELEILCKRVAALSQARNETHGLARDIDRYENELADSGRTAQNLLKSYDEAQKEMARHLGPVGRLKGFSVLGIKSRSRIRAEMAQFNLSMAKEAAERQKQHRERLNEKINARTHEKHGHESQIDQLREALGGEEHIARAREIFLASIRYHAGYVDKDALSVALKDGRINQYDYEDVMKRVRELEKEKAREKARERDKGNDGHGY